MTVGQALPHFSRMFGGPGSIEVYVTNTTDAVIDTNGYFGP